MKTSTFSKWCKRLMERSRQRELRSGFERTNTVQSRNRLTGRSRQRELRPAFAKAGTARPDRFDLEHFEPRLMLAADLIYAALDTAPAFDQPGIEGYIASGISPHFTLQAENVSGT